MKIVQGLIQGTAEWLEHRANARNASDAPAVMGVSKYKTRDQLMNERATGITPEVDAATQVRFDRGHAIEEAARLIAERIVGDDLFPVIGTTDDGYLSASFDGLTMCGTTAWECKSWNEQKAAAVRAGEVPETDYWQVIQQLVVSGAERVLYMITDGTEEKCVWMWVELPEGAAERLVEGWKQFDADLSEYTPGRIETPDAAGRTMDSLPALSVRVEGRVLASNLDVFREHAMAVIEGINTDLQTDQDFADAEAAVKWCRDVESRLDGAEQSILGQTADIDAAVRTVRDVKEATRQKRLALERMVKAQKEVLRQEIALDARASWQQHADSIAAALGHRVQLNLGRPDIDGAMKGKRTIASLRDAASTAVAQWKVSASLAHQAASKALAMIDGAGRPELFRDINDLVTKDAEALEHIISGRIAEAERQELARQESERERIRAEEEARARQLAEREAQVQVQVQAQAQTPIVEPAPQPQQVREPAAGEAMMKLGDINALIAPLSINADGLAQLGFQPAGQERAARLYRASDFPAICRAMYQRLAQACKQQEAA